VLDRAEQIGIVVFWSMFAWRMLGSTNPYAFWVTISEFGVLVFTLLRRPSADISVRPGDWMLAATATFAPLMLMPAEETGPALADVGLFLLIVGNFWQCFAKFVLRRSFGIAPANRGIVMRGPYLVVRHPIYAGYLITHLAFLIAHPVFWNGAVIVIADTALILRALIEERVLNHDAEYQAYCQRVGWHLVPGVF
jgi:protein-S-isoprenylcysteine O-methyltransferase Ste14